MGLIETGRGMRQNAMAGMLRGARYEDARNVANKQMDAAETNQKATLTSTGAISGLMLGAQAGGAMGPVGLVAGAGIGYLMSELF